MKRGLKKKGSSLVAVLVICSILLVTATTMIGVATSDIRMRMNQSKQLQNLYKSDSGLETFINVINKDVEQAIEFAKKETEKDETFNQQVANISDSDIYDKVNKRFKYEFIKALMGTTNIPNKLDASGGVAPIQLLYDDAENVGNSYPGTSYSKLFSSLKYYKLITNIGYTGDESANVIETTYEDVFNASTEKPTIKVLYAKYDDATKKITFTLRSSFSCSETSTTKLANKKVVETKITVQAPEYAEILERNNATSKAKAPTKAITIDGNLNVNADLEINGDAWVKGNASTAASDKQSIVFSKYNGGIVVANGKNLTVNELKGYEDESHKAKYPGNIMTASTFNITKDSTAELAGTLYSGNTFVGEPSTGITSSGNTINLQDVITYNDFGIDSISSIINMKNYYGINDGNTNPSSKDSASKQSSCILINDYNTDSKLNINENAYIEGVAYINTGSKDSGQYQTGESIAVKGNYSAYQEAIDTLGTPEFKYYDPVQLVEKLNGTKLDVNAKKEYFETYWQNKVAKSGNVTVKGKVYSTGAYVTGDNNNTKVSNKNDENISTQSVIINSKREDYAEKVFAMGADLGAEALQAYANGKVKKSVTGDSDGAEAIVDFNKVSEKGNIAKKSAPFKVSTSTPIDYSKYENSYSNFRYVLNNSNDDIIIKDGEITIGNIDDKTDAKNKDKYVDIKNDNVEAVIITKGNVKIEKGVNFKGTIIAGGDIEVNDKSTFTYNPQLVAQIIYTNGLADVFTDTSVLEEVEVNAGDLINVTSGESNGYNVKNIVKTGLWSLVENKDANKNKDDCYE